MMLKMFICWNWRSRQGIHQRLSTLVAAALLLLVVGLLCSRFEYSMTNIPDHSSTTIVIDGTSTQRIKIIHPSKGPGDPPILAYWIFGFRGESKRMLRLLKAVYHPRNQYLLHLLDGEDEERMELALSIESERVFRAFGNVNVVGKSYAVNYHYMESGASSLAAMLHAAALLLRISPLWDWFFTLSSSDYPLFTQDGNFSDYQDINFVGFTSWSTTDQKRQHNFSRIVVDPSLYSKRATNLHYAVETRELPTSFDIFGGSPWMALSRDFMEHCIKGWDNFPRKLLMYYANVVSPLESYFQTVLCNSPEFRNTIVNQDLRCSVPINVSNYDNLVHNDGAIFARPFKEGDHTLDELDRYILNRSQQGVVPGKWCNHIGNYSSCSNSTIWDDIDSLNPGFYGQKLQNMLSNFTAGNRRMVVNHCHGSSH